MTTNEMLNLDEFYDENGEPRVLTDEEAKEFAGKWSDPELAKYFWWCMESAEDIENRKNME